MNPGRRAPLRYVALGDSYTIGTAVAPTECWPTRLVETLARGADGADGIAPLELVANLGVSGYTSADLIRDELPALAVLQPGFASILIGVNDVVQGVAAGAYEANLRATFARLLDRLPAGRIVAVSTPDYTVTPRGADFGDPVRLTRRIAAFNAIMARVSAGLGVRHVDILDLSRSAAGDRSLVAEDGLHPSGRQYGMWVERIAPVVAELLAD